MVPTIRPSEYTSILAPTRCGVEPVVETIVTSAAGSPRSSAADTAAKTSRFICGDYRSGRPGGPGRSGGPGGPDRSHQVGRARQVGRVVAQVTKARQVV